MFPAHRSVIAPVTTRFTALNPPALAGFLCRSGCYSWGNMINGARLEMAREPVVWWSLSAVLAFMFALVLAANLFADTVQDAFDPRRSGN